MAVFIKKDRLGSKPPPEVRRAEALKQRIENTAGFKALRMAMAESKAEKQADLKDQWESNAEVQQWRRTDATTRGRDAVERMIPTAKEVVSSRKGTEATYEEARSYAEGIANLSDRKKSEGD